MARRKIEDHHIRSLIKIAAGSSYSVTLPIDMIRELGWRSKQKLIVKRHGEGLLIKDWKDEKE